MSNININYKNSTIEIFKTFEKQAQIFGSDAYIELSNARKEFPHYRLVIKSNKSNSTFKGMDFKFMLEYISKHDNATQRQEEFEKLRKSDLSYGEIKQWFVSVYPVFKECKTRAQWILVA